MLVQRRVYAGGESEGRFRKQKGTKQREKVTAAETKNTSPLHSGSISA